MLTRRSVRDFKDPEEYPLPDDLPKKLIVCGTSAPSACNQQPWLFVVIKDRDLLSALSKENMHGRMLDKAGFAIAVCFDDSEKPYPQLVIDDCAAATQNILLAAHEFGYGAVWLGIHHDEKKLESTRRILKIPGNVTVMSIVAVGTVKTMPPFKRGNYPPERTHINTW
jgi:nitroreductase